MACGFFYFHRARARRHPCHVKQHFESRPQLAAYLREQFPEASGDLAPMPGGEQAARTALARFRPARYAATRNYLSGSVSRLSPYLRHGVLTLREVFESVKPAYKFVQELSWRDYWQRLYFEWGDGIWLDREEWKTGWHAEDYADELPADISDGATGLACMDSFAKTLVRDGYLHNHARMWFAAYVIHFCRIKWQAGARWFLIHLLDGDPASNNLSWQWVASTFGGKPYIFNRENLERYTEGVYCAACPSRQACPFEKSYDQLNQELFRL
jgi:deoxyribodipyrimidine photo-lyase